MTEFEIPMPVSSDPSAVERLVESVCADVGLAPTMKGTLRGYPGSVHWHYKQGHEAGVLEVTYWPSANRLWMSVQDGRSSVWTSSTATELAETLSESLRTQHYAA